MVTLDEHFYHNGTKPRLRVTGYGLKRAEKSVQSRESVDRFSAPIGRPPLSSPSSVVKKSASMNSEPGIWNTLIHREAAEVNGGPTTINDQQFGSSDDLFIDRCSLFIERSADSSGNALGFTPSSAITECLYNQQCYDLISGQYYMRARNYDPATGTFAQRDTISIAPGDLANANLFLFAGADPINMLDPSGHDLMETLGSLAIQSMIGSIISPVVAPFASYAAALLIPPALLMALETVGAPDAIELGVSGTAGGQFKGFGAFGTGGLELLASPHTGNDALYGYAGGGLSFSASLGTGGSAVLAGSIGAVWSTPLSHDYTSQFWTLSVPFGALPARARAHIIQDLAAGAVSKNPFSSGGLIGLNPGQVSAEQLSGLENAYKSWNWILNRLDSLTINMFMSSPLNFQQSWGVSFSMDVVGGSTSGMTPNLASVGWTYYWQLAPSGNAVFA